MANTAWRAVRARCPYYRRSGHLTVTCSPADGDEITRRLPSTEACQDWFGKNCAMHYTRCPVYRLIVEMEESSYGKA